MNMELFRLINNLANKNGVIDRIMIFFSNYVPYIFMAVTVIVFILGIKQKKCKYREIAFSTIFITIINMMINLIFTIR